MAKEFSLDSRLASNGEVVSTLLLSRVIFVNNKLFPWLILVPQRPDIREIIDLKEAEQQTLLKEIILISKVVKEVFNPFKLNIAALGNMVPQLHVHIVGRFETDAAWPDPVFGKGSEPYDPKQYEQLTRQLASLLKFE
jgi:diadenosine tetraphosphate (Ap4A) HIT family hydrolase